jgi:hypothetical protein
MANQPALWTIMVYISADSVLDNFAIESLKQLRQVAGGGVTVEVLFEPNGGEAARRVRFDGHQNLSGSLFADAKSKKASLDKAAPGEVPDVDTSHPATLKKFIDSVTPAPDSTTSANDANRHYGLILWGHGFELLLETERRSKRKSGSRPKPERNYLTPARLRDALAGTKLLAKKPLAFGEKSGRKAAEASFRKLDFIALDACSMSMVEVAAELCDHVDFMIASQDDVPDQSFPYEQILSRLKSQGRKKSGTKEACRMIPTVYKDAFQDYFPAPGPAVMNVTLASLNLQNIDKITAPLKKLATALQQSAHKARERSAIIRARRASRGFVLGLFVDIYDFCEKLEKELEDKKIVNADLKSTCREIRQALSVGGKEDDFVLSNQTNEKEGEVHCHGLSIYLPYLTADENRKIEDSLTIGGTGIGTQLSKNASTTNLHKDGSTTNLHKSRAARITETEEDLASLTLFNEQTGWKDFIKDTWSFILAKQEPMQLDLHYSAQQCVRNLRSLFTASGKVGTPGKIKGSGKSGGSASRSSGAGNSGSGNSGSGGSGKSGDLAA